MATSIAQSFGHVGLDRMSDKELRALFAATLVDMTALKTQLAQLITDYNANANIVTDTTAVAPTLTLTV